MRGSIARQSFQHATEIQRDAERVIGHVRDRFTNFATICLGDQIGGLPATFRIAEDVTVSRCCRVIGVGFSRIGVRLSNDDFVQRTHEVTHPVNPNVATLEFVNREHGPQHASLAVHVGPVLRTCGIPGPLRTDLAVEEPILPQAGHQIIDCLAGT